VTPRPKHTLMNPSVLAWTVLAAFFIAFGLLFYLNSLGIIPMPDSEFIESAQDKDLPLGAVSASALTISLYGSLGFAVAGGVFLFFAVLNLREH